MTLCFICSFSHRLRSNLSFPWMLLAGSLPSTSLRWPATSQQNLTWKLNLPSTYKMKQILTNKSVVLLLVKEGLTNTFKTKTDDEGSREKNLLWPYYRKYYIPNLEPKKKKKNSCFGKFQILFPTTAVTKYQWSFCIGSGNLLNKQGHKLVFWQHLDLWRFW